jgi:hypothetical protein
VSPLMVIGSRFLPTPTPTLHTYPIYVSFSFIFIYKHGVHPPLHLPSTPPHLLRNRLHLL